MKLLKQVQIQRKRNQFNVQMNSQKSKATVSEEKPVTIGVALPRWRALKEEKLLRGGTDVALSLSWTGIAEWLFVSR